MSYSVLGRYWRKQLQTIFFQNLDSAERPYIIPQYCDQFGHFISPRWVDEFNGHGGGDPMNPMDVRKIRMNIVTSEEA